LKKLIACFMSLAAAISLGPTTAFAANVPASMPDKGVVVFYRTNSIKGAAVHLLIRTSEGAAGNLTNGSMFYQYYDPGPRTFDVSTPSIAGSDLISIDVKAGETYFVRGEVLMGWPVGRPKLTQEQESKARRDIGKL